MSHEEWKQEYEYWKSRCDESRDRDGCGTPTIFTLGCGECVFASTMRGLRKKIQSSVTKVK